jgi:hypothetical protein
MDFGMAEYRVYAIGDDGHIVKSTPLICDDDSQAVQKAREFCEGHTLEIWSGERFVVRLNTER